MVCRSCNMQLMDGAKYCIHCGEKINVEWQSPQANYQGRRRKKKKKMPLKFIRNLILIGFLAFIVVVGVGTLKQMVKADEDISFKVLGDTSIPTKILEILPKYQVQERALACKVDGKIYLMVTRGEKPTGGYSLSIDKIERVEMEDGFSLSVYVDFEDPSPTETVTEGITYPFLVASTNLKEMPKKIDLKVKDHD